MYMYLINDLVIHISHIFVPPPPLAGNWPLRCPRSSLTCAQIYTYIHTFIHVCIYICIYIYVCIYLCICI